MVLAVLQNIRPQLYGIVAESKSHLDSFDFINFFLQITTSELSLWR